MVGAIGRQARALETPARALTDRYRVTATLGTAAPSRRDGLSRRLGAINTARVQAGGFTPGLAARLHLATGEHLFAKNS